MKKQSKKGVTCREALPNFPGKWYFGNHSENYDGPCYSHIYLKALFTFVVQKQPRQRGPLIQKSPSLEFFHGQFKAYIVIYGFLFFSVFGNSIFGELNDILQHESVKFRRLFTPEFKVKCFHRNYRKYSYILTNYFKTLTVLTKKPIWSRFTVSLIRLKQWVNLVKPLWLCKQDIN